MSYHNIIIVGNLTRDPEMRYTQSGQAVTSLNVAVNDNYTSSSGEKVERTLWFRVSVWGRQAETVNNYLKKGRKVLVEGRLQADPATGNPRIWTRQDGTPGTSFEVNSSRVVFLSSRGEGESESAYSEPDTQDEGDIPF